MSYLIRTVTSMIKRGESGALIKELCNRIYSEDVSMVLRRDLRDRSHRPRAKIPLSLRRLAPEDVPIILKERPRRLPVLMDDIPTCFVAVTDSGELAYMQWLIFETEWQRFKPHFKGHIHAPLRQNECLFEFAYTFEKFRGLGVMSVALVLIAEEAVRLRPWTRYAYNFVRQGNLPSLKGCRNAGFRPYARREEHWRALGLRQSFFRLEPGSLFSFEETAQTQMHAAGD